MAVPNVEGFTAMLFAAGYALGALRGIIAAGAASLIYFGLNPQGLFPPLLVSQILGAAVAAVAGAVFRLVARLKRLHPPERRTLTLAAIGILVTLIYDILTNSVYPIFAGLKGGALAAYYMAAIPFSVLHIGTNLFIFIFVVPALLNLIDKSPQINDSF